MAFLILALSCTPCCAGEKTLPKLKSSEIASTQSDSQQHDHDHEHEICNPFCVCACGGCVGFFSPQPQLHKFLAPIELTSTSFNHLEPFFLEPSNQIWQPPKI